MDFETETFIATTLRARAGSRGVDSDCTDTLIAHTLRGEGFDASEDGTGRGIPLVPVADTLTSHWHNSNGAKAGNNAGMINPVIHPIGVRRLTPRECERLQGFLDNYTRIPVRVFKRQPKTKHFQRYPDLYEENPDGTWTRFAADGPRYKALGNSMAVPCMAWIGQRIQQVENLQASLTAAAE